MIRKDMDWSKKAIIEENAVRATQLNCENVQPDSGSHVEASVLMKFIRNGLTESSNLNLVVQRDDPDSPLHSVKTFEALHLKDELLQGFLNLYELLFNVKTIFYL